MMLDPVQNASGTSSKPNSVVVHSTHSSAQPLRCNANHRQVEDEFLRRKIAVAGYIEAISGDRIKTELAGYVVAVDG